ncbi:hypothetical protein F511_42338 [Dorcoceras hygrometricum]|uniref:Uncharacterized protein n=1 Tax=Dorcoceras hygrometricum TaxID=472368 RepID=A0A2Z7A6J2_9LAMI|nr:hypothetical protein F511_42338 [Dorcoceras hygrometricum]
MDAEQRVIDAIKRPTTTNGGLEDVASVSSKVPPMLKSGRDIERKERAYGLGDGDELIWAEQKSWTVCSNPIKFSELFSVHDPDQSPKLFWAYCTYFRKLSMPSKLVNAS